MVRLVVREEGGNGGRGDRCGGGEKLTVALKFFSSQMVAPPSLLVSETYFI